MVKFETGDILETKQGIMFVQCPITFTGKGKYDKLGGKTLYWLKNDKDDDVLFWDYELEPIVTENITAEVPTLPRGFDVEKL